ncbi:MAG: septal ring lytic transglycosylase RlpA family protein [Burkholderiales bacterium]
MAMKLMARKLSRQLSPIASRTLTLLSLILTACSTVSPPPVIDRTPGTPVTASTNVAKPVPPPISSGARAAPSPAPSASSQRGGYYKDDGPGDNPPPDLDKIADARPRIEPLHRFANNPYNVFGQDYVPMRMLVPFRQSGVASWYGKKFHGQRTSSGETYDMYAMTAAHPTLPIPSYVRVSNQQNGRSVVVRVNDRGPFHAGRVIDLSFAAAFKLGYVISGSTPVQVELLQPDEIAALAGKNVPAGNPENPQAASLSPLQNNESIDASQARSSATVPQTAINTSQPTPLASPAPVSPVTNAGLPGNVFLQLGAFSARDNAEGFRARVYREVAWLNDPIEILQRDGLFRLHLGPYPNREQAAGMAERLRREVELKPVFVIR